MTDNLSEEEIAQLAAEALEEIRLEKAIEKHLPEKSRELLIQKKDREFFRARITRSRSWMAGWPAEDAVGVLELIEGWHDLYFFWFEGKMFRICPDEFEKL